MMHVLGHIVIKLSISTSDIPFGSSSSNCESCKEQE